MIEKKGRGGNGDERQRPVIFLLVKKSIVENFIFNYISTFYFYFLFYGICFKFPKFV